MNKVDAQEVNIQNNSKNGSEKKGCSKCSKKSKETGKPCKACGEVKKTLTPYIIASVFILIFTIYGFVEAIGLVIGLFSK